MKQMDWKSFAIGTLLTTTLIACIAATDSAAWDENQKWDVILVNPPFNAPNGYEPFSALWIGDLGDNTVYEERMKRPQIAFRKLIN